MTKATTLVLMHLEKASYEELKLIQAKVEERLLLITADSTITDANHFIKLMRFIDSGDILQAVKLHKENTGLGLKEAKEFVDNLKQEMKERREMIYQQAKTTS